MGRIDPSHDTSHVFTISEALRKLKYIAKSLKYDDIRTHNV